MTDIARIELPYEVYEKLMAAMDPDTVLHITNRTLLTEPGTVVVGEQAADNYFTIVELLGCDEHGDPVQAVKDLLAKIQAQEPASIMTYDQAATLFRSINVGYPLGADPEGNVVTAGTKLGLGMEILGYRSYLPRAGAPKPVTGQAWHPWDTKQAVEFLRGWALALSKGAVA